jgi:hypothetical protein
MRHVTLRLMLLPGEFGLKLVDGIIILKTELGLQAVTDLYERWADQGSAIENATLVLQAPKHPIDFWTDVKKQWTFSARRGWDAEKLGYGVTVGMEVTSQEIASGRYDPFG